MRFLFNHPGTEGGFVWLRDTYAHNEIEVTLGYGSLRAFGVYRLPVQLPHAPALQIELREQLCRAAIAAFLQRGGAVQVVGSVDQQMPQWGGELVPLPDLTKT